MNKKTLFVVVALFLGIFGVLIVAKNYQSVVPNTQRTLRPVTLRLVWVNQAQFTGFYWAKEKGYYAAEGLDVTIKEFEQNLKQAQELADGKVEFSILSAAEVLNAVGQGLDIKAIATIYQKSPYAFVSRQETGIASPVDFKGKILGVAGGNEQAKAVYQAILSFHGMSEKDVTFKNLSYNTPQNVENSEADVFDLFRIDQPYLLDQKEIKYNLILPEQFGIDVYGDVITTTNTLIKNDPDLVQRFTRASLKGWEDSLNNVDESLNVVALYENEIYKNRLYEKHILEKSMPLIRPVLGLKLGGMQYVSWNKYYQALLASKVIQKAYDVQDAYTTEFLED